MWRTPKHTNYLWKILNELLPNWKSFCVNSWFAWTFLNNVKRTKTIHQDEILKLIILIKKIRTKKQKRYSKYTKIKRYSKR